MGVKLTKPKNSFDSIEKIDAIGRNDSKEIQQLYLDVYPKIKVFILRNNGNEHQAKDIFQEAFIALWRNIKTGNYNSLDNNIEAYLFMVAKNKWIDFLRSARYRKKMSIEEIKESEVCDDYTDKAEETEEMHQNDILYKAVSKLAESCRKLLKMFYYERKSMKEISEKFKISEPSARNKKYRCMQQLRKYVNGYQ